MQKFGLIGKTLKHSYSKTIHSSLSRYSYDLIELTENQLESFVMQKNYCGYNVTIPFKEQIIPFLDELDKSAKEIGAVNTVINKNGKLIGYNTDIFGMEYALEKANVTLKDKVVLILGSGGTSKTAKALAKSKNAKKILFLSRNGEINYQNYSLQKDVQVIINTTPVGMYPNNYDCKIDLSVFPLLEGVFDAVYNPSLTYLTFMAKKMGIKYCNGLPMLVAQAKGAMELFLDKKTDNDIIENVLKDLKRQTLNIVLIGMSGVGKTTIGTKLAKILDREFIDTDKVIEKNEGKDIPTIFKENGEEYFRELESQVIKEVGVKTGKVIATGGGAVIKEDNLFPLKQNGLIFFIERDLSKVDRKNRPLATSLDAVKKLFEKRKPLYENFKDFTIKNDEIENAVKGILDIYENISC